MSCLFSIWNIRGYLQITTNSKVLSIQLFENNNAVKIEIYTNGFRKQALKL